MNNTRRAERFARIKPGCLVTIRRTAGGTLTGRAIEPDGDWYRLACVAGGETISADVALKTLLEG